MTKQWPKLIARLTYNLDAWIYSYFHKRLETFSNEPVYTARVLCI